MLLVDESRSQKYVEVYDSVNIEQNLLKFLVPESCFQRLKNEELQFLLLSTFEQMFETQNLLLDRESCEVIFRWHSGNEITSFSVEFSKKVSYSSTIL